MKKFLSLVLTLALTLSLVVLPARAAVTSVTLNKSSTTIVRGNTEKLTATVTVDEGEAQTVNWTSDNHAVATVGNDGTVTAVGAGNAIITATSTADSSKTDTCTVTVSDKLLASDIASITVNGRTYNGTTVYMTANETLTDGSATLSGRTHNTATLALIGDTLTVTETGTSLSCTVTVNRLSGNLTVTAPAKLVKGGTAALSATYTGGSKTTYEWTYKLKNSTDGPTLIPGTSKSVNWTPSLEAGNYTVTCTAKEGTVTAATGTENIEIVADTFGFVTNSNTTTLQKGDTVNCAVTFCASGASATNLFSQLTNVDFTSNDTSVVTVTNSGKVTAVGDGETYVTVKGTYLGKEYTSSRIYFSVVSMSATLGSVENGDYEHFTASEIADAVVEAVNKVVPNANKIDEDDIDKIEVKTVPGATEAILYNDDYDTSDKITGTSNKDITNSDLYIEGAAGRLGTVSFDVNVKVGSTTYVVTLKVDVEADDTIDATVSAEENGTKVTFTFPDDYASWYVYTGSASFKDSMYSNYSSSTGSWSSKYKADATYSALKVSEFDDGDVTLYVVGLDSHGVASTGKLTVSLDAHDIEYSGVAGETITFNQDDFDEFLEDTAEDSGLIGKKGSTAYVEFKNVVFTVPTEKTQGILYNNGTKITSKTTKCTDLDNVTFAIASKASNKVLLKFTLTYDYYKDDKSGTKATEKTMSGRVLVSVVSEDIKYTVPVDGSVTFKAYDFEDFYTDEYKNGTLSYVKFTELPKVADGALYATYSTLYAGTLAKTSDKFYYDSSKITDLDLDDVTFRTSLWSKTGTKVYLPFEAYGTTTKNSKTVSSTPVKGCVVITITAAKTMNFTDVTTADWFYDNVKNAYTMGLIEGKTATTFNPNDNMTYAEAVTLAARMNELYNTGKVTLENSKTGNWYSSYESYAISKGIISSALGNKANTKITRRDYVEIFYNALPASAYTARNSITKIPDLANDSTNAKIYTFYKAGILTGYANTPGKTTGSFGANDNIKRSEVATILIRMMDSSTRMYFTL